MYPSSTLSLLSVQILYDMALQASLGSRAPLEGQDSLASLARQVSSNLHLSTGIHVHLQNPFPDDRFREPTEFWQSLCGTPGHPFLCHAGGTGFTGATGATGSTGEKPLVWISFSLPVCLDM